MSYCRFHDEIFNFFPLLFSFFLLNFYLDGVGGVQGQTADVKGLGHECDQDMRGKGHIKIKKTNVRGRGCEEHQKDKTF